MKLEKGRKEQLNKGLEGEECRIEMTEINYLCMKG